MSPVVGYVLIAIPWLLESIGVDSKSFKDCTSSLPEATVQTCKDAGYSLMEAGKALVTLAGGVFLHKANPFKVFGSK